MTSPNTASSLTAEQRQDLAARLRQLQDELVATLADQQGGGSRADHAHEVLSTDAHDAREHDADREVDLARVDMETVELAAIRAALDRVASPDFGACRDCGDGIPFARLQVEPWTRQCIACASKSEGPARRTSL